MWAGVAKELESVCAPGKRTDGSDIRCRSDRVGIASPVVQAAHQVDIRVLQKVGQSEGGPGAAFRALQLLQGSRFDKDHASDSSGDCGSRVDAARTDWRLRQ